MRLANAPVSFGVYVLDEGSRAGGAQVARDVADLGYEGIDSGPIGLFGEDAEAVALLKDLGLGLCGGWIDLPFTDPHAFAGRMPEFERALDFFSAADEAGLGPVRPMLADSGNAERAARPGTGRPALDSAGWDVYEANLAEAVSRVRSRGLAPTFHHHIGTYVETVEEIDRLLALSDIGLTLDTGHLLMVGGDPVEALARWSDRIDHIHLKDVDLSVFGSSVEAGRGMQQVWRDGPFVTLGSGALDLKAFLDRLERAGYDGWVIVEQDVVLQQDGDRERALEDQRANRLTLAPWFPMQ